ncbi:type I-E CRISPR-associated protein Cse1/CasA [Streptomyces lydicus]|uniref:type I-E CRISPR-associated protein Cse1/CasA n=1 Tax=Streptomyces lydicus TaxID=47763 RepID=UPI0013E96B45|nr:type I-E CRISPR-associated protein Cse1/CasA [Streptomyces lydicus]MCZ1012134.1 type I-E CRISPR-associated protein Cse1/CasA [Streptomyces lydicus]
MSFDLVSRPWVPVLTAAGPDRLPLREVLSRAHEIRLAGQPEEHTVLLRLLLAVLAAAARPADAAEWDAAWQAPTLDARIDTYLDNNRGRFDLFCPTHPFWQSASLTAATRDVRVLEMESWGSGTAQFAPHLLHPPEPMDPASAALCLVLLHAWHPGGIQSGHPDDPATRGGKVYGSKPAPLSAVTHLKVTGSCLKDELLLNCPPGIRASGDSPVWERDSPAAPMRLREPTGPLDMWTWPARRVRLIADEKGRVTGVAVHDGDRPADPGAAMARYDPGVAVNGRGTRLSVTDAARHLLPWSPATLLDDAPGAGSCPVLDHITAAAERGVLPPQLPLRTVVLRAEHTSAHRAALSGIVHLSAPLGPAGGLADPARRAELVTAARLPWQAQKKVTRAAADTLPLSPATVSSRTALSLAPHLDSAWEATAADPATGADAWTTALARAIERVAASGAGGHVMAAARIHAAALAALPQPTRPTHDPEEEGTHA